jgi:WD40 repeat protein
VDSCHLSPDGKYLATDQEKDDVIVWDVAERKPVVKLPACGEKDEFPRFSRDGNWLATIGDGTQLWRFKSGRCTLQATAPFKCIGGDFSPDGTMLAVSLMTGKLRLLSIPELTVLQELPGNSNFGFSLRFSPDGRKLASLGADSMLRIWDVAEGRLLNQLIGHETLARNVAWSPDGTQVATASNDGTVKLWDPNVATDRLALDVPQGSIRQAAFMQEPHLFAAECDEECVWDLRTGKRVPLARWQSNRPSGAPVSRAATDYPLARLCTWQDWDAATHRFALRLNLPSDSSVAALTQRIQIFVDQHRGLLEIDRDWNWRWWSTKACTLQQARRIPQKWARIYAVSPNGRWMVVGDHKKPFELVDAVDSRVVRRLGEWPANQGAAFSPDGRLLVVSNAEATSVWDLDRLVVRYRLDGAGHVSLATFSPDGRRIATAAYGDVRLWDTANGQELLKLSRSGIEAVVFSRDGRSIVSHGYVRDEGSTMTYWPSRREEVTAARLD